MTQRIGSVQHEFFLPRHKLDQIVHPPLEETDPQRDEEFMTDKEEVLSKASRSTDCGKCPVVRGLLKNICANDISKWLKLQWKLHSVFIIP
jgi:hypothetical protein